MATKAYVEQLVNALPVELRYPLRSAFWYLMDNWRIGAGTRAENAQWYPVTSTTASVANQEFTIAHGLGAAPKWLIPLVDVTAVGASLVPLQVSRAADSERVYLKSSSTSAVFRCVLEV